MHKDDLEAFRKRAFSYAYRLCRNREAAEDLAGECVLIVLEHPHWKFHNLRYRVADVIRLILGRPGSPGNLARRSLESARSFDVWAKGELGHCDESLEMRVLEDDLLRKRLTKVSPKGRQLINARLAGFTCAEIGISLSVGESRVSQLSKAAVKQANGQEPPYRAPRPKLRLEDSSSRTIGWWSPKTKRRVMFSDPQKQFLKYGLKTSEESISMKDYRALKKADTARRYKHLEQWPKNHNDQIIELEIRNIKQALAEGGDRAKAAFIMGLNRTTLVEKMKKLGLSSLTAKQCRDELKIQVTEEDVA